MKNMPRNRNVSGSVNVTTTNTGSGSDDELLLHNSPAAPLLVSSASNDDDDDPAVDDDDSNNNDTHTGMSQQQQQELLELRTLRRYTNMFLSPFMDEHGKIESIIMGMATLILFGSIIGSIVPKNYSDLHGTTYPIISSCIGYTYFLMWSVSFYPQIFSNYRRKTTMGLSIDFCILNVLGFACYAAYNVCMYYSTSIQQQYKARHGSNTEITVQSNDVAFAVHALLLASITLFQIMYYDGLRTQKLSPIISTVILCILGIIFMYPMIIVLNWSSSLQYLYILSYIKILVTLIKYIPQVILNIQRQSTVGWSIWQILLDFSGGTLSNMQLVLDCWNMNDYTGITGNVAKLILGSTSMIFDIIFMIQHYVLYPRRRGPTTMTTTINDLLLNDDDNNDNSINDDGSDARGKRDDDAAIDEGLTV